MNKNDELINLTDSLNNLTIGKKNNNDISNTTIINSTLPKGRSTVAYHNSDSNS